MGITFEEMIRNDEIVKMKFKEDSNVFSYYFVTSLLILNLDLFMKFCNENQNTLHFNSKNLQQYVKLIKNIKDSTVNGKHKNVIELIKDNKRTKSTKMAVFDIMEIF